jgi:hypothetical protein
LNCTGVRDAGEGQDWQSLVGKSVEICRDGKPYRSGLVELAMPDGSGLWIAADGILGRELIWNDAFTVHEDPSQKLNSTDLPSVRNSINASANFVTGNAIRGNG